MTEGPKRLNQDPAPVEQAPNGSAQAPVPARLSKEMDGYMDRVLAAVAIRLGSGTNHYAGPTDSDHDSARCF